MQWLALQPSAAAALPWCPSNATSVLGGWVYYGQHGLTFPLAVVLAAVVIAVAIMCAARMLLRNRD